MSNNFSDLEFQTADLHHVVLHDGTSTLAQIIFTDPVTSKERVLAEGTARRRSGDRRDPDIGASLAMSRAYRQLSDQYMELAASLGAE